MRNNIPKPRLSNKISHYGRFEKPHTATSPKGFSSSGTNKGQIPGRIYLGSDNRRGGGRTSPQPSFYSEVLV